MSQDLKKCPLCSSATRSIRTIVSDRAIDYARSESFFSGKLTAPSDTAYDPNPSGGISSERLATSPSTVEPKTGRSPHRARVDTVEKPWLSMIFASPTSTMPVYSSSGVVLMRFRTEFSRRPRKWDDTSASVTVSMDANRTCRGLFPTPSRCSIRSRDSLTWWRSSVAVGCVCAWCACRRRIDQAFLHRPDCSRGRSIRPKPRSRVAACGVV